jgi:hemerythrin-like domain-containing protein
MPDVFDVLGQDHEQVKQLLTEIEAGPTAASGAADDQLAMRKKMANDLVTEEAKHEAVEEVFFWPAVRRRLPDGERLASTGTAQEEEAKGMLAKLDKADPDEPIFEQLLAEFIEAGREHIAFEETQVWPALRAALSKREAAELGDKLEQGKAIAPTRPHPRKRPAP